MATATLLYRVDAGPLLSTSSTLAGGETISLTAASFAGWAASAALWEILDYPPGWPAPAGWSTDSVNERYYYRASTGPSGVTPPDFVVPTAPTFGKILFRLTVNGTIFSSVLGVKTRSPTIDLDDIAYGESDQWGGPKDWPSDQKDNIRKIDAAALAAAGTEAILVDSTTTAYPSGVPIRAMTTELAFVRDLATSGATADVIDVCRSTGGAGANGDGARLRFRAPDVGSVRQTSASISAEWVNVGVIGGPSSRLVLSTTTGGVAYAGITLSAAGAVRFNGAAYASAGGRFVVDGSGNVTLQAITEAELRTAAAGLTASLAVNSQKITGLAAGGGAGEAVEYSQLGSYVPTSRTVQGSDPIRIAGDNAAHDLSANRTWSFVPGANVSFNGYAITACTAVGNAAGALALTSGAGNASLDSDAGSKTVVGATSTQVEIGAAAVLTVAPSLVTSGKRVEAPRFTAAPSTPASAGAAVTFNLSTSQNVKHSTTEATTVTFSNAVEGMAGYIEFIQGGTGYTVTMPTNGVGVEYSNAIAALTTTGIVDATANTRTMLRYYVTGSPAVRVVIDVRAVSTIP